MSMDVNLSEICSIHVIFTWQCTVDQITNRFSDVRGSTFHVEAVGMCSYILTYKVHSVHSTHKYTHIMPTSILSGHTCQNLSVASGFGIKLSQSHQAVDGPWSFS